MASQTDEYNITSTLLLSDLLLKSQEGLNG